MWEPVGPLPASVYWRRRWVAIASAITALVLVAWSVTAMMAPGTASGDGTTTRAASRAALTAPQPASPPPAPTSQTAREPSPSQPGAAGPVAAADTSGATDVAEEPGTSDPTAPVTTSEELVPDNTPRVSVPVPPPAPVPPTGPVPCTNDMIEVAAEIDSPEHRVGQRPTLRLVVTNISDQPCVRDLDSARQEIVVWSGDGVDRLWSSNDCVNGSSVDLRTLVPGQPVAFAVRWAGRTSTPGCAQERTVVPPGAYRVMSRVDDDISAPTPFLRSA
jgi:hypothetical protein